MSDPVAPVIVHETPDAVPLEFVQIHDSLLYHNCTLYKVRDGFQVDSVYHFEVAQGTGENAYYLHDRANYPLVIVNGEYDLENPNPDWPFTEAVVTVAVYDLSDPDSIRQMYEGEQYVGDFIRYVTDAIVHNSTLVLGSRTLKKYSIMHSIMCGEKFFTYTCNDVAA